MANTQPIGFIGGGNMAEALIKGLLAQGQRPEQILVADPSPVRQALLHMAALPWAQQLPFFP